MRVTAESVLLPSEPRVQAPKALPAFAGSRPPRAAAVARETDTASANVDTRGLPGNFEGPSLGTVALLTDLENQLNSLQLSAVALREQLHGSEIGSLMKTAALVRDHASELAHYLTSDPKGSLLPRFIQQLALEMEHDHRLLQDQCDTLTRQIEQVCQTVTCTVQPETKLAAADPGEDLPLFSNPTSA